MAEENVKEQFTELLSILSVKQKEAMASLHAVLTGDDGQAVLAALEQAKDNTVPGSTYEKVCQNMANAFRSTIAMVAQGMETPSAPVKE